jgi:DivIVA domain-containing protein
MAASLSRPDPSSPASVAEAGFSTTRRGFQKDEVRAFLTSVAAELGRLQERERQLQAEVRTAADNVMPEGELDEEAVSNLLGVETLRVLQTARESASQIKVRAEETAAGVMREANEEANRVRQSAEVEAARKRHDASAEAEAEVALAKQQGREMVNEARAYRERVLADLERRTKLARQHIEELSNGRDRLLQVFERARLVAVDVTSDLQAIDGPDEFVSLASTTGPVPLMVPAGEIDELSTADYFVKAESDRHQSGALAELVAEIEPESALVDPEIEVPEVEAPAVEATEVDESEVDAGIEQSEGDLTDEVLEVAEVEESEVEVDEPKSAVGRDANVVELFRGRAPAESGDDPSDAMVDDNDASVSEHVDQPDRADGIFERLRTEAPDASSDVDGQAVEPDSESEPSAFSRRDEVIVPLIVSSARKLKRVLADEQNGVLDTLRQSEPVTNLDEVIDDFETHAAGYLAAISEELIEAAASGAAEFGAKNTKTLKNRLQKSGATDDAGNLLRGGLVEPLRDRLERAISNGGGDNEEVTKKVRAVYREWKTQHIDDLLDDVLRYAHGGGARATANPGDVMVWMIDPSEESCPDCEDNSLAGSVAAGEAYPTGHTAAPAHPGCRCLTLPVAK